MVCPTTRFSPRCWACQTEKSSMKVLVVEDSKRLGGFLKRALEEEGYVTDIAIDGKSALAQFESIPYDVVVLDWMLPDIDGVRVCRELRARGVSVPIVMLTARAEVSERITGLDAGADDYIVKPFDLGEFLARVRARARREVGGNAMILGPLMIDRAERRAVLPGGVLSLTTL